MGRIRLGAVGVLEGPPHHSLEATIMARVRRPTAGPGRPKKWPEELVDLFLRVPKSYKERFDTERGLMSRTEYFVFVMDHTHKDIKEMGRRIAELEQKVALLEKELEQKNKIIVQKDKIIERQNRIIEEKDSKIIKLEEKVRNLEAQIEALKQGRSVRSYQDALKLKELAKHAREGVSWKALCAEVLGLRDEKKIKDLLKLAFVVRKNDRNRFPDKFYPKDIAEEFHGWILKRPETKVADIIDYELYREDTLKAAKAINKGEAVPEVKPLKTGKAAERWLATFFEVVERQYMGLLNQKRGKEAKEFLEESVPTKLEKVLQDIDPADWRRAVLAVLDELEARAEGDGKLEAFVSNLRRVVLRALKEAESHAPVLEVKADV